jgi:hypothetical protein
VARFGNREERERYMDDLEWQMEHQREEIQRTLDRTMEGEGSERRTALQKFWGSLPGVSGRTRGQGAETPTPTPGEAREAAQSAHSATLRPHGAEAAGRPWWRRILGG